MCASVHTYEREGVCGASKAGKDAGGTIYGAKSDKFKKTFPKGKIGADEDIFSRCEVTKSAAYSAYVSICGASKARKDASGTIYGAKRDKFKKTFPKGKIGADEDIFSRCEVTKSAAYSAYVSICGASKAEKDASGTIYGAKRDKFKKK